MKTVELYWKRVRNVHREDISLTAIFIITTAVVGLVASYAIGVLGLYAWAILLGIPVLLLVVVLRVYELAAIVVILLHIYVDWYLGLLLPALVVTLVLLILFFLLRDTRHSWQTPDVFWLWAALLVLAIYPAIVGVLRPYDAVFYYPNIIVGALLSFWLGTVVAKDVVSMRRVLQMLAFVGAMLALHSIVQATTGITLLGTARFDQFLSTTDSYEIVTGSNMHRVGSFFVDPNYNGAFLAMMLFLPLGLFVESQTLLSKLIHGLEFLLMLPALLFTYSNGAWVGVLTGFVVFFLLVNSLWYRVLLLVLTCSIVAIGLLFFPVQLGLQLQHASGPGELSLRMGAWQTGINVMSAHPWTGIGLGFGIYEMRAEPYRDPAQYILLVHPHNSYIELGAKAGLPVLFVFLALLACAFWKALYNRSLHDKAARLLFTGGIASVVALSVNSWSINAWTLPPLAAIGWLLLGCISSPSFTKQGGQ